MTSIDATHDPNLQSWVKSANQSSDFPIQNLPFGIFHTSDNLQPRIGVAIGDQILDLTKCCKAGLLSNLPQALQLACQAPLLNSLMALGRAASLQLRQRLSELLQANTQIPSEYFNLLTSISDAELLLPVQIGDYTDFYASIFHATNVGKLFRPNNPLLPNYQHVPIAYHGRASSIVLSGTPIHRPTGQQKRPDDSVPVFAPTQMLDYELELGFFVSVGNDMGHPIPLSEAEAHLFGFCLVNDWSARDIQAWEYQPLGPFLAKNFATTISPWIVTLEALAPFRCAAFQRGNDEPAVLPYLSSAANNQQGGIDLTVEALISSAQMRQANIEPLRLSNGSFRQMYWTVAQLLTHHTSNGCNLRSADLLASGTISGAEGGSQGCLLEIAQRGAQPIQLPTGEIRSFLEDGDEIILRGFCQKAGFARIGLGECRGMIV